MELTRMANTAKDIAAAPAAQPAQPEKMPDTGGRYTRLPDGTLALNTDTPNTPKD